MLASWAFLLLAIGALLLFLDGAPPARTGGQPVSFRALALDAPVADAAEVSARLAAAAPVQSVSTGLDNRPLWIRATFVAPPADGAAVLHVPTGGIAQADFVVRDATGQPLIEGSGGRYANHAGAQRAYPGFAIALPWTATGSYEIVMRVEPVTVTPVHLRLWGRDAFDAWQLAVIQRSVVVIGALLFLAIYAFTAAIASRRPEFSLLGAWLLARCGMVLMDSGFGASGFKTVEPMFAGAAIEHWLTVSMPLTTLLLARVMLARTIALSRLQPLVTPLLYGLAVLFCAATVLPVGAFQVSYWTLSGLLLVLLLGLVDSARRHRLEAAGRWFAAGALCDGAGAIFALLQNLGVASPASTNWLAADQISLAAAVLAGIAVGQRLNSERDQRLRVETRALELLDKYQAVYRTVPIALVSVQNGDRVVRYNDGFARLFGLAPGGDGTGPATGEPLLDLPQFPSALRTRIRAELSETPECDFEFGFERDGRTHWLRVMARGDAQAYEASLTDITGQKAVEQHLARVAEHDPLTGALNRLGLSRHLQRLLDGQPEEIVRHTAICYADLDRFKMLNDLFGHNAGDAVLCEVVNRLRNCLGPANAVARLGGDEFVMVLGAADQSVHEGLAWRALAAITGQPFQFDGKSFTVTASIGVFRLLPGLPQADLIASADRSCQDAKRRGRNQVVICEDSSALMRQQHWEQSLVARLNDPRTFDEFELVAQPIVGLHALGHFGCELLLRHRGENDALTPAASLIAAAETHGEMAALDRWVLNRALQWLEANRARLGRLDFVSVNLSGTSLNDEFFKAFALAMLTRHQDVAPFLVLEITEAVATQDIFMTRQFAMAAHKIGARVALDDFGSGYSNFSSLATMPASFLKIDGRFVRSLREDGNGLSIVRTISLLAHELQMACIAEWVEDLETLRMLRAVGIDHAQGHVVAAPVRLDVLTQWLEEPERLVSGPVRDALGEPVEPDLASMNSLARKIHGRDEQPGTAQAPAAAEAAGGGIAAY